MCIQNAKDINLLRRPQSSPFTPSSSGIQLQYIIKNDGWMVVHKEFMAVFKVNVCATRYVGELDWFSSDSAQIQSPLLLSRWKNVDHF